MFLSAYNSSYTWNRYRTYIFKIALAISLFTCWVVINYQRPTILEVYNLESTPALTEILTQIPRTIERKKTKKVTPPPKKKKPPILIDLVDVREAPADTKFEDIKVVDTMTNEFPVDTFTAVAPPAPIIEIKKEEEEDIAIPIAEQMPVFGNCHMENLDRGEIKRCSDLALLKHIHGNLKYPAPARNKHIIGTVVIRFIVNKKGEVKDAKLLKGIGAGCGLAALEVIKNLPSWQPGKQNGRPVSVLYTIPIKFELK